MCIEYFQGKDTLNPLQPCTSPGEVAVTEASRNEPISDTIVQVVRCFIQSFILPSLQKGLVKSLIKKAKIIQVKNQNEQTWSNEKQPTKLVEKYQTARTGLHLGSLLEHLM